MNSKDYQLLPTDTDEIVASLVSRYETLTGRTLSTAAPERILIQWVADVVIQERVAENRAARQNIPSLAEGDNLDKLGELFGVGSRPAAQPAVCVMRFNISAAQESAVLVPKGTRVTDTSGSLVWETDADAYVDIGDTSVDVQAHCQTAGKAGNGFVAGQINTAIDVPDYYASCANITMSEKGADAATDEEYYELMRGSMDSLSCAGSIGSYVYFAKAVSTEIGDVIVTNPSAGKVVIYVLMQDGTPAGETIKAAVLKACSADDVRPLTDQVTVSDPATVKYNINIKYFVPRFSVKSSVEIQQDVERAVEEYKAWQSAKLGRDINPSQLTLLLMQTGIKRVEITSPQFVALSEGNNSTTPQLAVFGTQTIVNGGAEHE